MDDWRALKERLLVHETMRWVGVTEQGGNNRGQLVEIFQRAVSPDGRPHGEPWCMAFVQYCIKAVDTLYTSCIDESVVDIMGVPNEAPALPSTLFRGEHCLTVWNRSSALRIATPQPGNLCVWQRYQNGKPTPSGHVGIITWVKDDGSIITVEGNTVSDTDPAGNSPQGVFIKHHALLPNDRMCVRGFLRVW